MSKKAKLSDLIADNKNFNKGTEYGQSLIEKSLRKFGAGRSILIDKNNRIIAGNKTVENAAAIGLDDLQIVESDGTKIIAVKRTDIDLDSKAGRELALADNATSKANIDWDIETTFEVANEFGFDAGEWGIKEEEVEELEAKEDDFDATPPIEAITVLGDLYEIGEHRLLCGDSTDSDSVALLTNGEKADMVFTDPPYGIKVVKSDMVGADFGVAKKGKYSEVIADDTTDTAREFYDTCVALGMDRFIIWGGNYFTDFLPFSDGWLIWNKRAGTDIRNTFADGEMAWCSFHTPIRIYDQLWNGMIRAGEKEKRVHPTQKPIKMLSEVIQDHVKGDLLFDGFLGSGSTMVAAHQLKRKCFGMELDPKYCDVIVRRMLKLDPTLTVKRNQVDCKDDFLETAK
jgi:16S rRNA G966 N2-methylase RsmD